MTITYRNKLLTTSLLVSASMLASPALAQTEPSATPQAPAQAVPEPIQSESPVEAVDDTNQIVVTGSRIVRPNLTSNSPVAVVTGEETVQHADVTLETFLNTLPQVNAGATTTSNNPSAGGAAFLDLRGLGANRNLVLVNGRRPMVASSGQLVDVNTIPQALIERIDVVTGGAGATYGADAIAGVVNIILKDNFEGVDLRASYANAIPETDAYEWQISGVIGGNFADDRGNFALSADVTKRQPLIKAQRAFASQATSTTPTPPTGRLQEDANNIIDRDALAALFTGYGTPAASIPSSGSLIGFNSDGSLFGAGQFNTPEDVANFRYGANSQANPNTNFFPDFYSYNFDIINLLVLPLDRKSVFAKGNYEISSAVDVFVQGGYTEYTSQNALAPTPLGVHIKAPGENSPTQAFSPLIAPGGDVTGLVVPVTNPFIPADLAALLATRTGDSAAFAGSGADEAISLAYRFLPTGLRVSNFDTKIWQGLVGVRGDIAPGWRYEAYASYGKTVIDTRATGNVNVQKAQQLLEAGDGGASLCEGGFNPFGIQPLSPECAAFVDEDARVGTEFTQKILQAYVSGEIFQLPAGPVTAVFGAERRAFDYNFDPGSLFGPIAGFNTAQPAGGTNSFTDFFGELNVPIAKDQPWAESAELNLQARRSKSEFKDRFPAEGAIDEAGASAWAYGINGSWAPIRELRLRAAYQHSVRAPNFGELFAAGGGFPQIFDPCSINSNFRLTQGAAGREICRTAGLAGALGDARVDTFVATPGAQAFLTAVGSTNLDPEKGDTITLGAVFQKWGFTGSVDYYNIKVSDAIFAPDPNLLIAACFNYSGLNPDLDPNSQYCSGIFRQGGNIAALFLLPENGGTPEYYFTVGNNGKFKTTGLDFQLAYRVPMDFLAPAARLDLNVAANHILKWERRELPGLTIDYAGTASYFGAGLGTSFPRWKGNFNAALNIKPFTFETRLRYIASMKNRISLQFPGEEFTGPKSIIYTDVAVQSDIRNVTLRLGINNLFDLDPPQYSPNVQSGTDPSTYDVIGRRAYVQARLKF